MFREGIPASKKNPKQYSESKRQPQERNAAHGNFNPGCLGGVIFHSAGKGDEEEDEPPPLSREQHCQLQENSSPHRLSIQFGDLVGLRVTAASRRRTHIGSSLQPPKAKLLH